LDGCVILKLMQCSWCCVPHQNIS